MRGDGARAMSNTAGTEPQPSETEAAPPSGRTFPSIARRTARLSFVAALVAIGLWVARDFLIPLGWAAILALALWPLYRALARGRPGSGSVVPPLLFTLGVSLVLLIPLSFAALEVGREGQAVADWLGHAQESGLPEPSWLAPLPVIGNQATQWWREHLAKPQQAGDLLRNLNMAALANWTQAFGTQLLSRAFVFFVTMIALFFLLRDGEWLGGRLLDHADRVLGNPGEQLAERLVASARGTFNGTVLVAIGEGVLIGIAYFIAGVPRPMLFTVLTIALAMLPFGAWVAFTAAALLLLLQGGGPLLAGLLFGWGALVMVIGDNFIQPGLIGGAVRLPFLWALIGIFGGLETFGLLGLFLGPVIMAALMTVWREWVDRPPPSTGLHARQ
jgi:predicted PurR-regulated permease PerM